MQSQWAWLQQLLSGLNRHLDNANKYHQVTNQYGNMLYFNQAGNPEILQHSIYQMNMLKYLSLSIHIILHYIHTQVFFKDIFDTPVYQ